MDEHADSLNRVLRDEMTAVHQQFIHILALRDWGEAEAAERIMAVDRIDFPNAMRIVDYLVETEKPVVLPPDRVVPGRDYRSILAAEWAMEQRLCATLGQAVGADARARDLISAAEAPREAYAAWLAKRLDAPKESEASTEPPADTAAGVLAHLIAMIEQPMVHAFVHWHRGDAKAADAAWATSGTAMRQATEFVRLFAARRTVPVPGALPPPRIAAKPADALEFDRRLAGRCAEEADTASTRCEDREVAALCRKTAEYCDALSRWDTQEPHPAARLDSAALCRFEAVHAKYVRSC